jgi:hypothetical protein
MQAAVCAAGLILLSACSSVTPRYLAAGDAPPTEPATQPAADDAKSDFSLTIYSTANPQTFVPQDALADQSQAQQGSSGLGIFSYVPGFGVVREVRRMKLKAGVNRLDFTDVAAGIDPTTVTFRSLTAPNSTAVFEQNFQHDLASPDKLLSKYIGKEVVLTLKAAPGKDAPQTIRGKLLVDNYYMYVLQTDDAKTPIVLERFDNIDAIRLAELKTGFVAKPTLDWEVSTDTPGEHDVQVTYQTEGLTWRADYAVNLAADEKTADISAWVTTVNVSGRSYPNAKIKLVAGNVRRFVSDRAQQYGGQASLFSGSGGGNAGKPEFKEKGFFDYHLYTLDRPTTLNHNSTKQMELFAPKAGVKVEKVYVYYGLAGDQDYDFVADPQLDRDLGTKSNRNVDIYVRFANTQANGMGIPLPAGRIRLYKADPADDNKEFLGEDVIQHTPRDETVLARIGTVFDIIGDRVQTDFKEGDRTATESFAITLHNHKSVPAQIIIKENLFRWFNWEITASSDKYEKQDVRTIHIPVEVPANGEKKVTYTVKYSW